MRDEKNEDEDEPRDKEGDEDGEGECESRIVPVGGVILPYAPEYLSIVHGVHHTADSSLESRVRKQWFVGVFSYSPLSG